MPIDLSNTSQGAFGDGEWFSSVLLAAIESGFTGVVSVQVSLHQEDSKALVFFSRGQPVHASGPGFPDHHLGQVLLDRSLCRPENIAAALAEQKNTNGVRPLLGALLVRDGIDPNEIKRAIQAQTHARLASLMQIEEGQWRAAPGENPQIREVAVPLDGWATFFELLQTRASRSELGYQTDAFLGYAVQLKRSDMPQRAWTPEERKLLSYLKKPRKPHQLEQAFNGKRQLVRGFLRTLSLMERLELHPANKAIPIPKTLNIQGAAPRPPPNSGNTGDLNGGYGPNTGNPNLRDVVLPPKAPAKPHPMIAEIKVYHAEMENKNHFELMGAAEDAVDAAKLRKRRDELLAKFHPDALPAEIDREGDVAAKAREISARINEAYNVLGNDELRSEYLTMLQDERVKGDYRKLEKIRDAEMKCKMGVVHLNKKEHKRAIEYFKIAHENDPSCGLYQAYLAWATYENPSANREVMRSKTYDMLQEALKKDDKDPQIHLFMARILKALGRSEDALHHFKRVLRASPYHGEANSEVRHLNRRIEKDEKSKNSGLGRFFSFGKKD